MKYVVQQEGHITCQYENCGSCRVKEHGVPLLPGDTLENHEGMPLCAGCGEKGADSFETLDIALNDIHDHCRGKQASGIATRFGMIDGAHHKQWVIDQMLQAILGKRGYKEWIKEMNSVPDYDDWDKGIAP